MKDAPQDWKCHFGSHNYIPQKRFPTVSTRKEPTDLMRMIDGFGLMGIKLANLLELKSTGGENLEDLCERAIAQALDSKTT
jgi:hypothetical protein